MQSHRRRLRHIRALVLGLAACAALAAPAGGQPPGDTPADYPGSHAAQTTKIGDTPADFPPPSAAAATQGVKVGDTPVDFPGASRTPEYTAPTTIQVVRPERTIVRDVDEVLPIVLSSAALLFALVAFALPLVASIERRRLGH